MNLTLRRSPSHALSNGHFLLGEVPKLPALSEVPLVVDLDKCLLRTDLLLESALAYLSANPFRVLRLIGWLWHGRARLKRKLAENTDFDIGAMPINGSVERLIRQAKSSGRQVYLATGADAHLARKVAAHLNLFDGVIASDGLRNFKGSNKAAALTQLLPHGFDYVGDSFDDLHIWRHAARVIAVDPSAALKRSVTELGKPVTFLETSASQATALLKAARLHQWTKNTLVFVPALLAGKIAHLDVLASCSAAFLALGLIAFGTYLINDLWDLPHDRHHPTKCNRPLASGSLSIGTAMVTAPLLILLGLGLGAAAANPATAMALLAYLALTLAYSMGVKAQPVLDTVTLGALFTMRFVVGITAAGVAASPWLLVFSMFLFTSLCLAKRCAEIHSMQKAGETSVAGRGYVVADAPFVLCMGLATATASVLIMVLYLTFDAFNQGFYADPRWLWGLPLSLFLWITHIWLVGHRGELDEDPVAFALRDRRSLTLGGIAAGSFMLAWAGSPFSAAVI
jgi:4-hydroxybenzoate polyprenyltransferase/phosphoserine phosphatase